jgi:hypothetical protein
VRWIKPLRAVAALSPLHLQVLRAAVERALGDAAPAPRAVAGLIELLHEWGVESGEEVAHPGTRAWLGTITGSGKTASLARRLLKPSARDAMAHRRAAAEHALEQRIRRAERYRETAAEWDAKPVSPPLPNAPCLPAESTRSTRDAQRRPQSQP